MSSVATFENVGKVYRTGWRGGTRAVRNIQLCFDAGQAYALLGPNRAGKTTLVKMLLGLCRPTEGQVLRFGEPITSTHTLTRVGYVHENQHFPRYLSARELLRFYAALTLMPSDIIAARVEDLIQAVGLADRAEEPICRFSKGMVQRLGLAQSLLNDPDLLILDEPTEGLDLAGRMLLRDTIAERLKKGKTVILISHVLSEVEATCNRAIVIVGGKVVHESAMADLLYDSAMGRVRSLEEALRPIYEGRGS